MPGPVLRAQVVLSGRVRQASGLEWWWCQRGRAGARRTVRSLVWIGHKVQREEGRERFDLGSEDWEDLGRKRCVWRWGALACPADCEEADQGQGGGPTSQIEEFAVQPQRTPKGFSFSAGWLKDKYIL